MSHYSIISQPCFPCLDPLPTQAGGGLLASINGPRTMDSFLMKMVGQASKEEFPSSAMPLAAVKNYIERAIKKKKDAIQNSGLMQLF